METSSLSNLIPWLLWLAVFDCKISILCCFKLLIFKPNQFWNVKFPPESSSPEAYRPHFLLKRFSSKVASFSIVFLRTISENALKKVCVLLKLKRHAERKLFNFDQQLN